MTPTAGLMQVGKCLKSRMRHTMILSSGNFRLREGSSSSLTVTKFLLGGEARRHLCSASNVNATSFLAGANPISWFLRLGPKYPFAFGVGIATIKTGLADLIVQKYIEKKKEVDYTRLALFTVFGFAYLGLFQYALYVVAFSRLFKSATSFAKLPFREKIFNKPGLIDLGKQIFIDCFIHAPIFFFPCYYVTKECIMGDANALNGGSPSQIVTTALEKYKKNYWEDWIAMWKIWVPGDAFVFALPLWARLPANHSISFVYVCILSFMRGASEEEDNAAVVVLEEEEEKKEGV